MWGTPYDIVARCTNFGTLVLLHGFIKKSQKTPASDLDTARRRKATLQG
ncbi:hypothetical protein G7027_17930 [Pseudomonas japonica]|nr:hypothetical protein [Pseudomonas japonica]MBA1290536.1 hypothetical protein [Pseudomonas japonica]